MRKNIDETYKKEVVDFISNFLSQEGFEDILQSGIENTPSLTIVDELTKKEYAPTLTAKKEGKRYLFEVETDGKYSAERILKWKIYIKYILDNEGVFWMFVPSISEAIFEASLKQHKLREYVEVIHY